MQALQALQLATTIARQCTCCPNCSVSRYLNGRLLVYDASSVWSRLWSAGARRMVTLLRCRRLLPPPFRARFLARPLTATFLAYIYLLHSAHSIHVSRLSYSPTCQPVAAESSRAIQILKELQVTAACVAHFVAVLPAAHPSNRIGCIWQDQKTPTFSARFI